MSHELKVEPKFFKALWCGHKTFEIRKNDRNFEERDEITLMEKEGGYDHEGFTGREIEQIMRSKTFTPAQRHWILNQIGLK